MHDSKGILRMLIDPEKCQHWITCKPSKLYHHYSFAANQTAKSWVANWKIVETRWTKVSTFLIEGCLSMEPKSNL